MKQKVIIKSNKYGLIVHMDPDAEYTEILKELREKFTESARFFKDATMAVTFEGRILTKPQEEEVIGLITDVAHIHIVCIFDTNENTERLYKKVVEDSLNSLTRKEGQFYKGTLRQRQVLETEQSIIILGVWCNRSIQGQYCCAGCGKGNGTCRGNRRSECVYYGVVDETACDEDCRYCINTYISSGRNRKTKYRPS